MAAPTPQQVAEQAAAEAQRLAAVAQDAAQAALLDSIVNIADFAAKTNTRSEANQLKSLYISKFGYDSFSRLCGRSR